MNNTWKVMLLLCHFLFTPLVITPPVSYTLCIFKSVCSSLSLHVDWLTLGLLSKTFPHLCVSAVAYRWCFFSWIFVLCIWLVAFGFGCFVPGPILGCDAWLSWHLVNCIFCCIIVIYATKSLCPLCCVFICIPYSSSSWTHSWQSNRENHRPCRHIVSKEELDDCFRVRNGSEY